MHAPSFTAGLPILPSAQATHTPIPINHLKWNNRHQFFSIEDASIQGKIIDELAELLVQLGHIDQNHAENWRFYWQQRIAGNVLYVFPLQSPKGHIVVKRKSFKDSKADVIEHIKRHCTLETEIVDKENKSYADVIIYSVYMWEQFLNRPDSILREIFNGPRVNYPWNEIFDKTGMILLIPVRIFTSLPTALIGSYFRRQHYLQINDKICATRESRFALASLGTSLEIGRLGKFGVRTAKHKKPQQPQQPQQAQQAQHSIPLKSDAFYFARNTETGSKTELILHAKSLSDNVGQMDDIIIRPHGSSGYEGISPGSGRPQKAKMPISFDDQAERWYEARPPHLPILYAELQTGRTYVNILGQQYPLRMTAHMQYQAVIKNAAGKADFLPLYRDRISKKWHFKMVDKKAVFSPADEAMIERIKMTPDSSKHYELVDNDNPSYYLDGEIVHIYDTAVDTPLFHAVEMNGAIVPIKKSLVPGYGNRYDVADPINLRKSATVVWDGDRWSLEKATSPFVSQALKRKITPEMYASDVNIFSLSAPDRRGIRWDSQDNGFLKIRNSFVQVFPAERSSLISSSGQSLSVIFADGKFKPVQIAAGLPPPAAALPGFNAPAVAPVPLAPEIAKLNEDALKKRRFHVVFKHFLENDWVPEFRNSKILDLLLSKYPEQNIQIEQVPSTALQVVRTVVSVNDDQFVVDVSQDGKNKTVLSGDQFDAAIDKFRNRPIGGNIKNVIGLSRQKQQPIVFAPVRYQHDLAVRTRQRISSGHKTVRSVLTKLSYCERMICLILCNEDFFQSDTLAVNAYAPPEAAYEALIEFFIPLSHDYPNAIIAPGTIRLSNVIPAFFRSHVLEYTQENQTYSVQSAVHFSTVIAPVFFNGKIVTIARKGEYLRYQSNLEEMADDGGYDIRLADLNGVIPLGAHLFSHGENTNGLAIPAQPSKGRNGTIFTGKTLLPGEFFLTEAQLRPHMENRSISDFFKSDFVIRDEKFLYVLGNEFKQSNEYRPEIRDIALSKNETLVNGQHYDWLLHAGENQAVDGKLRSIADNYLRMGSNNQSECLSELTHRIHTSEAFPQANLTVHYFDLEEGE